MTRLLIALLKVLFNRLLIIVLFVHVYTSLKVFFIIT